MIYMLNNVISFICSILTKLAEYYIIFGGVTFLNDHAGTLQTMLLNLVGEVSPRGQAHITLVTEALLKRFPVEGGQLLLQCGLLKKLVDASALATEPDRVIVFYMTALARVFLAAPELLESTDIFVPGAAFGASELVSL